MNEPLITSVTDLLVAAGWDREQAVNSAPRFATTIVQANRPCECRNAACRMIATDDRHGTRNGYTNQRCRCRPCTRANATYIANLRSRTA